MVPKEEELQCYLLQHNKRYISYLETNQHGPTCEILPLVVGRGNYYKPSIPIPSDPSSLRKAEVGKGIMCGSKLPVFWNGHLTKEIPIMGI